MKHRKFGRLYYRILKHFEYYMFKKILNWNAPDMKAYSLGFLKRIKKPFFLDNRRGDVENIHFLKRIQKFNNNLNYYLLNKKRNQISYNFYTHLVSVIKKRKGKLGYLNWSMFYAHKTPTKIISHRRTWIIIGRKKYVHKKKNLLMQKDAAIRRIASFYGFTNINKLKKLLFHANFSSKLRKFSALNLEGKINIILYRLNIMSNIAIINRFIKKGRVLVNNTICANPHYSLKLNDNLTIDFKVYKFILGILKKRLKNKKIWSTIPSYLEVNYLILHFGLIDYPNVEDLMKIGKRVPYLIFNSDLISTGVRHFIRR